MAELEAAVFGAAGNETTTIITRTEPPILPSLEPPANPQQGDYYIRTDATYYSLGDMVHFEAKMPPCPSPIYGLDGKTIVDPSGRTVIEMVGTTPSMYVMSMGDCHEELQVTSAWKKDFKGVANSTSDHSIFSGHFTVSPEMVAGEHQLEFSIVRAPHGPDFEWIDHYSNTFTFR